MSSGEPSAAERVLAARVIDTLLREDYGGLSSRVRAHRGEPVLDLPAAQGQAGPRLPLERDGFLADLRVQRAPGGLPFPPLTLDDVDSAVRAVSDPRDSDGVAAFADECRQALAALQLRERYLPGVRARLARLWATTPGAWSGPAGLARYEALAAAMPHPAYPASEARLGLSADDCVRYAPEYHPEFTLRWVAVPRSRLITASGHGHRPPGWPEPGEVGLPASLTATHDLMPAHPLTARRQLAGALDEAGLNGTGLAASSPPGALVAPGSGLWVTPTLSTRTVAVTADPRTHLKLPLPTATLGRRNRRFIRPGTLADGALVREILATAVQGDPLLRGLLIADESSYAHAGHPYLAYLARRLPAGLDQCRIAPVAALLARGPDASSTTGPLVIEDLASWALGGDLPGLLAAYLEMLFAVHVRLFARYGIALEAHQQNTAVVLGPPGARAPLRLLVKDFDSALIHLPRLASALGPATPDEADFADPRMLTRSDDALADMFITIVVHLCAGALAFGLADRNAAPLPDLLALVRRKLAGALDSHAGWPAAAVLRSRVLDADRLTGKSMVTAGTLVAKSRTGASDINKFYGTDGPNYLKELTKEQ